MVNINIQFFYLFSSFSLSPPFAYFIRLGLMSCGPEQILCRFIFFLHAFLFPFCAPFFPPRGL